MDSPFLRQIFVASSPQLAALSVGSIIGYSNVVLEQLKSNESSIQVDLHMTSWIGSVHGLAGLPGVVMPLIMQWRGRKFTYIASCLIIMIGWLCIYLAKDVATIIIGECFHGLGLNSIIAVSFCTISEMVDPHYRTISMTFYIINQTLGISITGIIGRYLHWKTVSVIMSIPIIMAFLIGCMWPESPAWLAYRGEYVKCEQAFKWLRGTDENSQNELKELLNAHKENSFAIKNNKFKLKHFWAQISRRDFYLPCTHIFMTLSTFYFGGVLIVIVYGVDILNTATNNLSTARYGMIANYVLSYIGVLITTILLKLFRNKTVLITSVLSSSIFMLGAAVGALLQSVGILSSDSLVVVYFMALFTFFGCLGTSTLAFAISGELMPVKHRGYGEIVYILLVSGLDTLVLKSCPYLIVYIGLWRLFLLLAVSNLVCIYYVWRFVPETKGRTLQQIENYYNHGRFVVLRNNEDLEFIDKNGHGNN